MERLTYKTDNGEYTGMPNSVPIRDALERLSLLEDVVDLLKKCSIALVVPESECLNNERLTIQLYKKHTTKEQWEKLLELFDIK